MVVLVGVVKARNFSRSYCGMEKGLWEKSIRLSSSFHSYMGKSTIQQNLYSPCSIRFSSRPMRVRARPARVAARSSLSAAKNRASPALTLAGLAMSANGGARNEFGDRALADQRAVLFLELDIAQARRAFAAGPFIELVEEAARLAGGARRGNGAHGLVLEGLELDIGAAENGADIGDLDRIAQIRLVGAVFQHRLGIGNARIRRLVDLLAVGEFLEHALPAPARRRRRHRPG